MRFEIRPDGIWTPSYFRDDAQSAPDVHVFTVGSGRHMPGINTQLLKELNRAAAVWDLQLLEEGYLEMEAESRYYPLFGEPAFAV